MNQDKLDISMLNLSVNHKEKKYSHFFRICSGKYEHPLNLYRNNAAFSGSVLAPFRNKT